MSTFIITYDLRAPGRNYNNLYERIKSYSNLAHITESSWVIKTESNSSEVRDYLSGALDDNDDIFVGTLTSPAAWIGLSKRLSDWLKQHLP